MMHGVVVMLVLYAFAAFALRETAAGRHVYAVGNDPEAARLSGIATHRVLLGVYALAGIAYGVAALLLVASHGRRRPAGGPDREPGRHHRRGTRGTSLFGGRGMVLGSLVGALIVGVFRNGLTLIGVSSIYQVLITGILVDPRGDADQLSRRGTRA